MIVKLQSLQRFPASLSYDPCSGHVTTMLARHLLLPLVVLVVLLAPVLVTVSPEQVYQEVSLDQVCRAGAKVGNNLLSCIYFYFTGH